MKEPGIRTIAIGFGGHLLTQDNPAIFEIKNLTKRFGGLTAVDDVNLSFYAGQLQSIIGPNGAGKTTFFNLLTGMSTRP